MAVKFGDAFSIGKTTINWLEGDLKNIAVRDHIDKTLKDLKGFITELPHEKVTGQEKVSGDGRVYFTSKTGTHHGLNLVHTENGNHELRILKYDHFNTQPRKDYDIYATVSGDYKTIQKDLEYCKENIKYGHEAHQKIEMTNTLNLAKRIIDFEANYAECKNLISEMGDVPDVKKLATAAIRLNAAIESFGFPVKERDFIVKELNDKSLQYEKPSNILELYGDLKSANQDLKLQITSSDSNVNDVFKLENNVKESQGLNDVLNRLKGIQEKLNEVVKASPELAAECKKQQKEENRIRLSPQSSSEIGGRG